MGRLETFQLLADVSPKTIVVTKHLKMLQKREEGWESESGNDEGSCKPERKYCEHRAGERSAELAPLPGGKQDPASVLCVQKPRCSAFSPGWPPGPGPMDSGQRSGDLGTAFWARLGTASCKLERQRLLCVASYSTERF